MLKLKDGENEDAEFDQSVESMVAYKVKKIEAGEDRIEIAIEIEHFSHEHDLKLTEKEVHNNEEKCDGCVRAILPPFYSCAKCSFFLHKSCANLPMKMKHPLDQHPLTLQKSSVMCKACGQRTNGFVYICHPCKFKLNVQCSLVPEILTHEGHSTNSSSPTQALNRVAIIVVIEEIEYFVVQVVNLHLTINARHYHKPQGTNNMSIPSLSVMQLKMTLVNIIVIFVKKNETQSIGYTIV